MDEPLRLPRTGRVVNFRKLEDAMSFENIVIVIVIVLVVLFVVGYFGRGSRLG